MWDTALPEYRWRVYDFQSMRIANCTEMAVPTGVFRVAPYLKAKECGLNDVADCQVR